ncbi:hypothetical protein A2V49_00760 [candidate division WWE3 bacterium RBG_19FT_COMBO_34_6]|uniref:thioredoxin-dependent peroxiredoxin n=1 Tax=candidate division WWE3 bacterium RBG_19FT_COMBO_34_6 TaxID=1802612 RepID=A0A1F4UMD9_UNCKA|nr:MAG: hypothetical protein A2V49_00760 [candidate division WWE3 bacterium RBG_19FT_COMBO_34_6]
MILKEKDKALDFSLPDQDGKIHKLSDYIGSWVLLYFYPKDDTPGCTVEACSFRDNFPDFKKLNITILGVSKDSVVSHQKFMQKYKLPFTLLSDNDAAVNKLYDVWKPKKFMGKEFLGTLRTSFLIDPEGEIVKIYEKVKPKIHATQVLDDLKLMQ